MCYNSPKDQITAKKGHAMKEKLTLTDQVFGEDEEKRLPKLALASVHALDIALIETVHPDEPEYTRVSREKLMRELAHHIPADALEQFSGEHGAEDAANQIGRIADELVAYEYEPAKDIVIQGNFPIHAKNQDTGEIEVIPARRFFS
jgi:hypothetical protein